MKYDIPSREKLIVLEVNGGQCRALDPLGKTPYIVRSTG
jgi:hypothetical protein